MRANVASTDLTLSLDGAATTGRRDLPGRWLAAWAPAIATRVAGLLVLFGSLIGGMSPAYAQASWGVTSAVVTPTSFTRAGDVISLAYVVRNSGTVSISNIVGQMTAGPTLSCDVTSLAPGASMQCTGSQIITAADVASATSKNLYANFTGTPASGTLADTGRGSQVAFNAQPGYSLAVSTDRSDFTAVGQLIRFTYTITNTGNMALGLIYFDSTGRLLDMACPTGSLPIGQSITCTASTMTTAADVTAGQPISETVYAGIASALGLLPEQSVTKSVAFTPIRQWTLSAAPSPTGFTAAGQTIGYTYDIANTGNVGLSSIALSDTRATGLSCPATSLAFGATMRCSGTYVTTAGDVAAALPLTATASATATSATGTVPQITASTSVTFTGTPAMTLSAAMQPSTFTRVAEVIAMTYTVRNTGNVAVSSITVIDNNNGGSGRATCLATTLAAGASTTCSSTFVIMPADVTNGYLSVTAEVSATPASGTLARVTSTSIAAFVPVDSWTMSVAASPSYYSAAGNVINYAYSLTNTGNRNILFPNVTNTLGTSVTCPLTTFAPGTTITCTSEYTITAADFSARRTITNTATANATSASGSAMPTLTGSAADVPFPPTPSISLDMSVARAGGSVVYTFIVTNTGNTLLSNITPRNSVDTVSCPASVLQAGESMTCSGTHQLTAADFAAGTLTSNGSVTAEGLSINGVITVSASKSASIALPVLNVYRAIFGSFTRAGNQLIFDYDVRNEGALAVSGITVTDNKLGAVSCAATSLAPGARTLCSVSYTVTQADVTAGVISTTSSVSATSGGVAFVPYLSPASLSVTLVQIPDWTLARTAPADYRAAGTTLNYSYLLTNTGSTPIASIALTATKIGAVTCPATSLAVGANMTCTASYVTTAADVSAGIISETVTATGTPSTGTLANATAGGTVNYVTSPDWTVTGSASPTTYSAIGTVINYALVVTNTGNTVISGIQVSDSPGPYSCPATSLAVGASMTCTQTYTTTSANMPSPPLFPTGSAASRPTVSSVPFTGLTSRNANILVNYVAPAPSMTMAVSASPTSFGSAGQTINYNYVITNTGQVSLSALSIASTRGGTIACPATTLAAGASTTCTNSYVTTAADASAGAALVNTASATATPASGTLSPVSASASVAFSAQPAWTLTVLPSPSTFSSPSQVIAFTQTLTNTGNQPIAGITLTSPSMTISCPSTSLAIGANMQCSSSYTTGLSDMALGLTAGSISFAHSAAATTPGLSAASATTAVTYVAAAPRLAISVTPTPSQFSGAGQTISYAAVVTNSGNVAVSALAVTDSRSTTYTCAAAVLAPGASTTCTGSSTTTASDLTAATISNTIRANGTPAAGSLAAAVATSVVTLAPAPAWTVTSTPVPNAFSAAPTLINYSYLVSNAGNTAISSISISDTRAIALFCPSFNLAAGTSMTCTGQYMVTIADLQAARALSNTVSVTGTPAAGTLTPATATSALEFQPRAAWTLTASANPSGFASAGTSINYDLTLSNTGNVAIANIAISGTKTGAISCPATTLDVGATLTCGATYSTVVADVGANLAYTANASGTPASGALTNATASGTVTFTSTPVLAAPTLPAGLVGQPYSSPAFSVTGGTAPYTFRAGNLPGGLSISSAGVISGTPTQSGTFNVVVQVQDNTSPSVNGPLYSNIVTPSLAIAAPTIAVTTSALPAATLQTSYSAPSLTATGGTAPYSFSATGLPPGLSISSNGVISGTPTQAGTFTVVATATDATPAISGGPFSSAATPLTFTVNAPASPAWTVSASASPNTFGAAGTSIAYSYLVTNTGDRDISGITLTNSGAVTCPAATLAVGANMTCTGTYVTTTADVIAGVALTNTVTARGVPSAGTLSDATATTSVAFRPVPGVTVALSSAPGGFTAAGTTIRFVALITNTGNTSFRLSLFTPTLGSYSCPATPLDPGQSMSCTGQYTTTASNVGANLTESIVVRAVPTIGGGWGSTQTSATSTIRYITTPTIAAPTLPAGTVGSAYSAPALLASGGTAPYSFSATGLPTGLSMSTAGIISGTPLAPGSANLSVTATDSTPAALGGPYVSAARVVPLTIAAPTIVVSTSALPPASFGAAYSAPALTATGGTGPYTFEAAGLPNGLVLDANSGVISGTPNQAGTFNVSVTARDATTVANGGPFLSSTKTLTLGVAAPTVAVTTATLPAADFGAAYSSPALSANGGTSPYMFAASGLPAGVSLAPATGVLSGTPTQAGTFNVVVTATDATTAANGGPFVSASRTLTLSVASPTVTVTTSGLPAGAFGASYTAAALSASGGNGPYTFSASGLPIGLTLDGATGVISGTPTQAGTFTVAITATDSTAPANGGPFVSRARSITLSVVPPTVSVSTSSLPAATFGAPFAAPALAASGGTAPYAYAATGLPAGLVLDPARGVISGTPTQAGAFTVSITATDATTAANGGPFVSAARSVPLQVNAPVVSLTLPVLAQAQFGAAYSSPQATASGGTGPYTFSATGLPNGLTLDTQTGAISGAPLQAGSFTILVTARDATAAANGGPFISAATPMPLIVGAPRIAIATTTLPQSTFGLAYNAPALSATGGTSPYFFAATGLPSGLAINPATGAITGTPTHAGVFNVTLTATDATTAASGGPFVSAPLVATLVVQAPTVVVTTTALPAATFGQTYSPPVLTATGGTAPFTFAVSGLPAGMSVNAASGAISGTPTASGRFSLQITATDATPAAKGGPFTSAVSTATLDVSPPSVAITTSALASATVGVPYTSAPFSAAGGMAPYTFAVTGLPSGLSFSPATQSISGTPRAAGTFNVTVVATDATASASGGPFVSAARALSLPVAVAPSAVDISSSANPAAAAAAVTFTARVTPATATGSITFRDGTQTVGTATLAGGTATFTTSSLSVGSHAITAYYGGDGNVAAATSSALDQVITGTPAWTASMSANPTTFSKSGQTIAMSYTLRNTGNVDITGVTVSDARVTSIVCPQTTIRAGASLACTGQVTTTAADVTAGRVTLTATARGTAGVAAVADAAMQTSISYVPTTGNLSVMIVNTGRDGTFSIRTSLPGAETFNLTTVSGAASRTFSNVPAGSYTLSLAQLPAGIKRSTLRCNGVDQVGRDAVVSVTGQSSVTCTFGVTTDGDVVATAARTEAKAFIARRASTLVSAQPDRLRQFGRLVGSLFGGNEEEVQDANSGNAAVLPVAGLRGSAVAHRVEAAAGEGDSLYRSSAAADFERGGHGSPVSPFSLSGSIEDGNGRVTGSTSFSQMIAASLASQPGAVPQGVRNTSRAPGQRGDIWAEVQSTHFMDPRDSGRRGASTIGFVGADYLIHPAFLIGAMVQVDVTSELQSGRQATGGTGWMAGPYVAGKLTRNLMFDARAAWGKSNNKLAYLDRNDDTFATDRSLYMARLSGNWTSGAWRLSPEASVSFFKETQGAFVTADGVTVAEQSVDYGRVTFGPEIGYTVNWAGRFKVEPSIGVKGLWNFRDSERNGSSMDLRIEGGVRLEAPSGIALRASGSYQGFGDGNMRAVNGQVQIGIPFN